MKNDPIITIGKLAKRTGSAVSAIRFYASENLIPSIRSPAGHRLFHRSVIRRVSFILIAQNLGYSLKRIKVVLELLPDGRTPTKADWERLSKVFTNDIDEQIMKLQNLKESLASCIGCGCLSLKRCQLYNPKDRIQVKGAGPRYLLGDNYKDVENKNL